MKKLITKISTTFSLAILSLTILVPCVASAAGSATLTASSATASKGSAVTVTLSLDTAGNPVFGYQADMSYSTAYFNSASISVAPGSPFTVDTGANDPDIASGGNIHFTRFYTTAKVYSGPVATITLQSNGNVGVSTISFKAICPSTASTANCSAVNDSGGSQVLGVINSGSINITDVAVATSGGGAAASAKGGKKIAAASTVPTSTAVTSTPATTQTPGDTTATDKVKLHKVTLTVLDQDGKPVKNTKVTLDGVTGKTDNEGKVTIGGLEAGTAQGNVYYEDEIVPIRVKIGTTDSVQSSKVNINIKKANLTVPVAIGTISFLLAVTAFFWVMKSSVMPKLKSQPKPLPMAAHVEPHAFTAVLAPEPPTPPQPAPKPPEPAPQPREVQPPEPAQVQKAEQAPEPKPEIKKDDDSQLHEKAVDPGTVFTPNEK